MTSNDIASLFYNVRKAKGWTIEEMAQVLGVDRSKLTDWEHGFRLKRLIELLNALERIGVELRVCR